MNLLKYLGLPEIFKERSRCTLRITKKIFQSKGIETSNHNLHTLCDYFKILVNQNEGSFHSGLFDATMTSKLFIRLYKNYININDNDAFQKYQKKKQRRKKYH